MALYKFRIIIIIIIIIRAVRSARQPETDPFSFKRILVRRFQSATARVFAFDLQSCHCAVLSSGPTTATVSNEEERLFLMTNPEEVKVGISYSGPHIQFPLTTLQLQNLISAFKSKQVQSVPFFLQAFPRVEGVGAAPRPAVVEGGSAIGGSEKFFMCCVAS